MLKYYSDCSVWVGLSEGKLGSRHISKRISGNQTRGVVETERWTVMGYTLELELVRLQ